MKSTFSKTLYPATALCFVVLLGALASGQERAFSAAPNTPITDTTTGRTQVQQFNGLFVSRLIEAVSGLKARSCFRKLGGGPINVKTYSSGTVIVAPPELTCVRTLNRANGFGPALKAGASQTSNLSISASRIVALATAYDRFNDAPVFSTNDRDLSKYDVEIYDKANKIYVAFLPAPQSPNAHTITLGCPRTGPIAVILIVDPRTFETKIGNMVC